jgi:hypothetical protein
MARYKVLVIVRFPLSEKGMANRRALHRARPVVV